MRLPAYKRDYARFLVNFCDLLSHVVVKVLVHVSNSLLALSKVTVETCGNQILLMKFKTRLHFSLLKFRVQVFYTIDHPQLFQGLPGPFIFAMIRLLNFVRLPIYECLKSLNQAHSLVEHLLPEGKIALSQEIYLRANPNSLLPLQRQEMVDVLGEERHHTIKLHFAGFSVFLNFTQNAKGLLKHTQQL